MKQLFSCFMCICCFCFAAQGQKFTLANVHSHNDYEQKTPFDLAYRNQLGSIEADIHLVAGKILVGHDTKDLLPIRNFENMYLAPLLATNTPNRKLQLFNTKSISDKDFEQSKLEYETAKSELSSAISEQATGWFSLQRQSHTQRRRGSASGDCARIALLF